MLNSISRVFSITAFVILAKLGYSQYYYDTIPITYDAYVDQGNPNTNYGSDTLGKVGHYTDSTTHYQRFYVNFSLESIPEKARVIGTQINIPYFSQYQTIDSIAVYKVDSLWNEDSITANNQPAISTYDDGSWTWHEASTKTLKLEVWKAVSNYNEGLYHNFAGFVVEMESEIDTNFALIDLYTSEHSDSTKRPYVIVKYFYPTELTNIEVKHESYAGAGDGAISFTTTKGVSPFTYQWVDATGTVISTDSILDSLSAGWYGVYIDAAVGGWTQDEFYKEFLVGVECDTVSISVALDATYSIAAIVGNGSGWPDRNQPNGWAFLAARTNQVNSRTYYKAPIYVDPAFNVQSVDFEMHGLNHIGTNYHINKAQLMMVTEDWWERGVTYNNQPTFDTTNWVLVDSTHYLTQNRTVDLTDYWQYWQKYDSLNFGMLFKIIDENYQYNLRQQHYTANAVDTLRPTFKFVVDLVPKSYTAMAWDSVSQTGTIDIDISNYCGDKTGPYKYMISYDSIPDLSDLYDLIRDTVYGGVLDSTYFFGGTDSLHMSFSNLQSDEYFVSVFDSNWNRLSYEEVIVQGELIFEEQNGLVLNGNIIDATQADGTGVLSVYSETTRNSDFEVQLNSTSGEQFYGFIKQDSSVVDYSSLERGFYCKDDSLYTIDRGVLSASYFIVDSNDLLNTRLIDDSVFYYLNDSLITKQRLLSNYTGYRVGVGTQPGTSSKLMFKDFFFKKKKYWINSTVDNYTCSSNNGAIDLSVGAKFDPGSYTVNYIITDQNGVFDTGSGTTGTSIPITQFNGNPIPPGIYTITGEILSTSLWGDITINPYVVVLGYESVWSPVGNTDYGFTPNSYSVLDQGNDEQNDTEVRSTNVLTNVSEGWTNFKPIANSGINYFRFTTQNIGSPVTVNELFVYFIGGSNGSLLVVNDPMTQSSNVFPVPNGKEVRLMYDLPFGPNTNSVRCLVNNVEVETLDRNNLIVLSRCRSLIQGDGFENVINSFCLPVQPSSTISHAELKRSTDGGFTHTAQGFLKFTFDEEYKQEATNYVPFEIFDKQRNLVAYSDLNGNYQGVSAPLTYNFDDNKLELDLSNTCTPGEYYTLVVTTQTGEKRFLQFYYQN